MSGTQEESGRKPNPMILGKNTAALLGIESLASIQILTPWYQGGSETYVTDFLLKREGESPQHLIAKACIKMGARYAMAEWFKRRERLTENGITFPVVHAIDEPGATWVEEFIPYTYKEAYDTGDDQHRSELKRRFVETFLRMEGVGFAPKGLHDLRSHGEDVVVVDVGEDLGGWKENDYCDLGAYIRAEQFFRTGIPKG
jgi:hypothetical protein